MEETRQANDPPRCSGAEILDNLSQDHRDGIYFEFVTDSHVRRNRSLRNSRYGLHFMFSHRDTYSDNFFRDNGAGVAVMFSKEVEMRRNQFIRNRGASSYGLLLKEINDVVIDSNTFINNTTAMLVDGCNRAEVNGNIFQANGWGLRLFANSMDCHFVGNSFTGNTFDMSTNGNPVYNSFSGNYWDRYKGYDLTDASAMYHSTLELVRHGERAHAICRGAFAKFVDTIVGPGRTLGTLHDT